MSNDLISVAAYAQHRGVSRQSVMKAIKSGRLKSIVRDHKGAPKIANVQACDKEWFENMSESGKLAAITIKKKKESGEYQEKPKKPKKKKAPKKQEAKYIPPEYLEEQDDEDEDSGFDSSGEKKLSYTEAKAEKERFDAKLKKLKYEQESKTVVSVDLIKKEFFKISSEICDNLLNITPRLASNLAAMNDEFEITQLLDGEIRLALEGIADGSFNLPE